MIKKLPLSLGFFEICRLFTGTEIEALTGSHVLYVYASYNGLGGIFDGLPQGSQICGCFPSSLLNMHSNQAS